MDLLTLYLTLTGSKRSRGFMFPAGQEVIGSHQETTRFPMKPGGRQINAAVKPVEANGGEKNKTKHRDRLENMSYLHLFSGIIVLEISAGIQLIFLLKRSTTI